MKAHVLGRELGDHGVARGDGRPARRRGYGRPSRLACCALLLLLTSFKTYEELRAAGLSLAQTEELAVAQVRELVGG